MGLFSKNKPKVNLYDNPIMANLLTLAKEGRLKSYCFTNDMIFYNFSYTLFDLDREISMSYGGIVVDFKEQGYQTMPQNVFLEFTGQLVKEIKKLENVKTVKAYWRAYVGHGCCLYKPGVDDELLGSCVIITYNRSTNQDTSGKSWV